MTVRAAMISGGVVYHETMVERGRPLDGFEVIPLAELAGVDLGDYQLVVVPRSTDGEMLHAMRYQFNRFLDRGGVLITFGEQWANWFPGCNWEPECPEDTWEPIITSDHPLVQGYRGRDLQWHPPRQSWCCHGHFIAPRGAEVLVRNQRGDAWLYVDRQTTNGVIVAASNLDPDTHTYHGNAVAAAFFERLVRWAREEAARAPERRARRPRRIAGLYSGVHFQKRFYEDSEFAPQFAILPVWELAAANLHEYAALWIPRESNQRLLVQNREALLAYLAEGGTVISFEQANHPWLPSGSWELRPVHLDRIRLAEHPLLEGLSPAEVDWHSHGAYDPPDGATVLIDDTQGNVMLFLDERTFAGRLLAGTMDPDCHAGFGTERTRPLLRAILQWIASLQPHQPGVTHSPVS